jgi:hypothetical protein
LALSIVLFTAQDVEHAFVMYKMIFTELDFSVATQWIQLYSIPFGVLLLSLVLHYIPMKWIDKAKEIFVKTPLIIKTILIIITVLLLYQVFQSDAQPFIYLEF